MIKILRFTIGTLSIILEQLIALIATGFFVIGITIFINEIAEYSFEYRSITNQLIKELEKSHNETKSYSTLFSITTKVLQINQVNAHFMKYLRHLIRELTCLRSYISC